MTEIVRVWQLGQIKYTKALKLQKLLVKLHHENKKLANTLLCLEHPPVYTTGLRTDKYSDKEAQKLVQLGIIL